MAQIDNRADDGRLLNSRTVLSRMVFEQLCIFQGSCRAVFPEIDAFTEPIVLIAAWRQRLVSGENRTGHGFVAAMKAENEGGED